MKIYRLPQSIVVISVMCTALLLANCSPSAVSTTVPTLPAALGTLTFGSQDCGKLLAAEEVQAITSQQAGPTITMLQEGTCAYQDASGNPIVTVIVAKGAGQDCSAIGSDAETIPNIGDLAAWSQSSNTACVVRGDTQVQIVMGTLPSGIDLKTAATALITAAAARLP